jgi:uncharacterized protein (DUF952 family)
MKSENPSPEFIYKVAPRALWAAAETAGGFAGAPVDLADGFIHFSTAGQLAETLSKHFAGQSDLVLAAIRTEKLGPALKWEVSRGGALFPHLYAALDMAAVEWTVPLAVATDGSCTLPEAVR